MRTTMDLPSVAARMPWLASLGAAYFEAADVMLTRHHDGPSTVGNWDHDGEGRGELVVTWRRASDELIELHANIIDAVEYGAYALAIGIADSLGFKVKGRTAAGSGADWWMVPAGVPEIPEHGIKLEVSGIDQGGLPDSRLAAKVKQGRRGDYQRPGMAVVFRFQDASAYSKSWS